MKETGSTERPRSCVIEGTSGEIGRIWLEGSVTVRDPEEPEWALKP